MRRTDTVSHYCRARQARLRFLMEKRGLARLLVTNPANIFYLTGFRGSSGVSAVGLEEAFLWVDPRYSLQAREQAQSVEVVEARKGLLRAAGAWLGGKRTCRTGYEDNDLTVVQLRELQSYVPREGCLRPASGMIEQLRLLKDTSEIEHIREAGRITTGVLAGVLPYVRPGVTELDLEAEIEYRMRRSGAEGAAFPSIVASGERSALPHARASGKRLAKCELVILDLGAIINGYAADMTRTVYLGLPSTRLRRMYESVLAAQQAAQAAVHDGSRASAVDAAARRVLRRRGLEKYFTHSTGHGVGLEVHEQPRLARGETATLRSGCIVTVEPGIYLEGLGGIRIEDTMLVGEKSAEVLTPAPKDSWFTG